MSREHNTFQLNAPYKPAGDQPKAIKSLSEGLRAGVNRQTLLGVTGSGKTFTMANVIADFGKPALVIAHNKTLAAQLAQEYQSFFPEAAVHYFVSYYDFYQPEAYIPASDTYIEKDAAINVEIERLRHASTQALLTRRDTIIVASVSCIYGLGSPEEYERENLRVERGMRCLRAEFLRALIDRHFERTTADLSPGAFRAMGNRIEVMPVQEKTVFEIELSGDVIGRIRKIDPVSQRILEESEAFFLFPAKHFVTTDAEQQRALVSIRSELDEQLKKLTDAGKLLEADRLKRRTNYDLSMIEEIGYTNGIENYSRHLSGKLPGEPPETLLSYFPKTADGAPDFLTILDESHVTLPQIRAMYAGDQSRKKTLVEHGFRLPSALDNRPLRGEEFETRVGQMIFTSATPGTEERRTSANIVEQVIRPTGLVDPLLTIKPVRAGEGGGGPAQSSPSSSTVAGGQIQDFIAEAEKEISKGGRIIATTLTKKMAEDLSVFLKEKHIKAEYLHSDVKTIDRIRILTKFRRGEFDCLVGVNLLREGLDLPEVTFIGILDADKEGFLRSETSLIQTIGRAARNIAGRVTLYADTVTGSLKRAIDETNRRRDIQLAYNAEHGITPETVRKEIHDITDTIESDHDRAVRADLALDEKVFGKDKKKLIRRKKAEMNEAVKALDFETAAILRDEIRELENVDKK